MAIFRKTDYIPGTPPEPGRVIPYSAAKPSFNVSLRGDLAAALSECDVLYSHLGRGYYEAHKNDPVKDPALVPLMERIASAEARIADIENRLRLFETTPPAVFCPQCGSPINPGYTFCPRCGVIISRERPNAAEIPSSGTAAAPDAPKLEASTQPPMISAAPAPAEISASAEDDNKTEETPSQPADVKEDPIPAPAAPETSDIKTVDGSGESPAESAESESGKASREATETTPEICPWCDARLTPGAVFCAVCGCRIKNAGQLKES